jgi:uncharacterized protein (UPF0261 family)
MGSVEVPPGIAVLVTLDTKELEAAFLCDSLREAGARPLVVDVGVLGAPSVLVPHVSQHEVAAAAGRTLEEVRATGTRGRAVERMRDGARRVLARMRDAEEIHGGVAIGGAEGAVMGASALSVLPRGWPKVVVSPVLSGRRRFEPFVGVQDMTLMHSVVDIAGLNRVSRGVYRAAAAAAAGMARARRDEPADRHAVAITMLGNTDRAVKQLLPVLDGRGWSPVVFHSNGAGGRCMEEMVREGAFDAVLDLTTNEVSDELCGGLQAGGPDRVGVAPSLGVPTVVGLGCTDFYVLSPREIPESLRDRPIYDHNPEYSLVRLSTSEMLAVAQELVRRLRGATGPLSVCFPAKGLSLANHAGGLFWNPEADRAFWERLRAGLAPSVRCVEVSAHVNDRAFTQALLDELDHVTRVAEGEPPA